MGITRFWVWLRVDVFPIPSLKNKNCFNFWNTDIFTKLPVQNWASVKITGFLLKNLWFYLPVFHFQPLRQLSYNIGRYLLVVSTPDWRHVSSLPLTFPLRWDQNKFKNRSYIRSISEISLAFFIYIVTDNTSYLSFTKIEKLMTKNC